MKMYLSSLFLVLACSSQAVLGMLAILSSTYSAGTLTFVVKTWPDAPDTYDIVLVSPSGSTTTLISNNPTTPGQIAVALPPVPAGSYTVELAASNGTVYTTSPSFTVGSSDFTASLSAASVTTISASQRAYQTVETISGSTTLVTYTPSVTASPVTVTTTVVTNSTVSAPTLTTSTAETTISTTSVFTSFSVLTSGSITTTIPITESITAPATTSVSAATATLQTTTTSKSAGFQVGATSASSILGLVAAAVFGVLFV